MADDLTKVKLEFAQKLIEREERRLAKERDRLRVKYETDIEFREKRKELSRVYYHTHKAEPTEVIADNPKEEQNAKARQRYATNAEAREKKKAACKARQTQIRENAKADQTTQGRPRGRPRKLDIKQELGIQGNFFSESE